MHILHVLNASSTSVGEEDGGWGGVLPSRQRRGVQGSNSSCEFIGFATAGLHVPQIQEGNRGVRGAEPPPGETVANVHKPEKARRAGQPFLL